MNSVVPLRVALRREDVLHFLGYPADHEPAPRVALRLGAVLEEARGLVRAAGAFAALHLAEAPAVELEPIPAEGLVIGLVTAGGAIEARVAERLRAGDPGTALLFDAAGSAAAEEAADRLGAVAVAALAGVASDTALAAGTEAAAPVSCRISPGYGDWGLAAQRRLFARLPHRELGIQLTPSLLMVPRKSISFAMWLGADARPITGLAGCHHCKLPHCRYRRPRPS